jgi:hypothetical protein
LVENELDISPIVSRSVRPVTLCLLLRCRSCDTSWAFKALAGMSAWSDPRRQQVAGRSRPPALLLGSLFRGCLVVQ